MYLIVIAWLYVALMMAVVEATHTSGTVLGAILTFLLYGAAPVALVVYLMGSPARRRVIKAREAAELAASRAAVTASPAPGEATASPPTAQPSAQPDAGRHPAADPVAPIRKEP